MKWRILLLACLLFSVTLTTGGCTQLRRPSSMFATSRASVGTNIDPEQVERMTMNFAARYITATSDVYDQVRTRSMTPEARALAQQSKLNASLGALANAVDPSPVLGLMDMTLMVALKKEIAEDPWAAEEFGLDNAAKIDAVLTTYDAIIWDIAGTYLTSNQVAQLHDLVKQWREQHPGQRLVGGARLADFTHHQDPTAADAQSANNIFGLVGLDPFTGLDPAVRQVEESRVLAERMFFYMQYMPELLSWQADILYNNLLDQTLAQPQVAKFMNDTSAVAGSAGRFSDATARFSDYCGQFAQTVEKFRADLPNQLSSVVKQLGDLVATQREAALKQATADLDQMVAAERDAALKQANDELATQRDLAIKQLNMAVQTQQEMITKNLQDVLNSSIDRLYQRIYRVVLVTAAAFLAVLLIYRLLVTRLVGKQVRP